MAIIELEKVSYAYGKSKSARNEAIGDVSLKIEEGEYVGVIGHTGSGKSTLIKHLNCILKPTGGKIYIDGVDVWKDKTTVARNRQNVGLVFQYPEYQLFEETVEKDIAFGPKNLGLSADEVRFRVARAIEMVGLSSSLLGKNPFELSGGEKRRVAIAGILAMDPNPTNPALTVLIIAFIVSLITTIANKYLVDQDEMNEIQARSKKLTSELREAQKKGDGKKVAELQARQTEMMQDQSKMMTNSFKPMIVTFVPIILIFFWMRSSVISGLVIILPPSVYWVTLTPFWHFLGSFLYGGQATIPYGIGWLLWYMICTFGMSQILRKFLGFKQGF